ncbi:MAG: hypothetical protein N2484_02800 [Clostridia bacterium]|nr:hypothetical protein [Clostridia bacterium]
MENNSSPNNARTAARGTGIYMTIGWICAILSLFIYPFLLGVVGVVCGILSTKSGSRAGLALIVASILFMGIGLIFGPVLLNYVRLYLGI